MNYQLTEMDMAREGLFNQVEPSFEQLAVARPKSMAFALCDCGHVETNKSKNSCVQCSHALFWEFQQMSIAESKISAHNKRFEKKSKPKMMVMPAPKVLPEMTRQACRTMILKLQSDIASYENIKMEFSQAGDVIGEFEYEDKISKAKEDLDLHINYLNKK